ncbi:hypothetical protein H4696_001171 [Amycolatopsis lexingtonensis]|uniref:Uncharacterized protein n=1 Tax=Amycolatopsis lexingtonensis TaxID=218822 RepID=A0ABR9HT11_9PSEU|nr:hypothetical protein [Amycolatopsis lexingtonensis]
MTPPPRRPWRSRVTAHRVVDPDDHRPGRGTRVASDHRHRAVSLGDEGDRGGAGENSGKAAQPDRPDDDQPGGTGHFDQARDRSAGRQVELHREIGPAVHDRVPRLAAPAAPVRFQGGRELGRQLGGAMGHRRLGHRVHQPERKVTVAGLVRRPSSRRHGHDRPGCPGARSVRHFQSRSAGKRPSSGDLFPAKPAIKATAMAGSHRFPGPLPVRRRRTCRRVGHSGVSPVRPGGSTAATDIRARSGARSACVGRHGCAPAHPTPRRAPPSGAPSPRKSRTTRARDPPGRANATPPNGPPGPLGDSRAGTSRPAFLM